MQKLKAILLEMREDLAARREDVPTRTKKVDANQRAKAPRGALWANGLAKKC